MKKWHVFSLVALLLLTLNGCGSGTPETEISTQEITSKDGADDGFIGLDSLVYNVVLSSDASHTIEVSDDSSNSRRGFVSFSIAAIPAGATIRSATIFLPVTRATPSGGAQNITVSVDILPFPSLDTLTTQEQMASVYDATPSFLGPSLSVFPGDAGYDVTFDAVEILNQARALGFDTLQIRLSALNGDVVFDDLLQSDGTGTPMLLVEY